ncbi:MAG: hypothetical protein GY863_16870 [bacterium]|nr:hypothetical protein [bacterium]
METGKANHGKNNPAGLENRRTIGEGLNALERLTDFMANEEITDEKSLKRDFSDLIIPDISGISYIKVNQYYDELPKRGITLDEQKKKVKKESKKLVNSTKQGLLLANIEKKEAQVTKLAAEVASLTTDLERSTNYVEKKKSEIALNKSTKTLLKAELELKDWKNRLDHLIDGNNEHPEQES